MFSEKGNTNERNHSRAGPGLATSSSSRRRGVRQLIAISNEREDPPLSIVRQLPSDTSADSADGEVKVIAFYLPQFHPIKENDEWWGPGFTEWRNVVRARPNFVGHYQPHQPADFGYYDLRVPEIRKQQADLARHYGIHGFCYYHYWFGGRRVLERPFNEVLASGAPEFPFCLCWANENWTRAWDGGDKDILLAQSFGPEIGRRFITELIPAFSDRRYIRV